MRVIVAVGPAGEGAGGSEQLGVGAAAGGEELAAVDHRGGEGAVIDHGSGARAPDGSGRNLEQLGGVVAHEFEGVATLDKAHALVDEPIELDRLDLGAVLFGLAAPLRLLVDIELALDAVGLAVKQVDEGPEEVADIVLEPRVRQHGAETLDHAAELGAASGSGNGRGSGSSWPGRWPWSANSSSRCAVGEAASPLYGLPKPSRQEGRLPVA
jgi:hypothetical protein